MKMNKKKFLSLAIVFALLLGVLAACGGGDKPAEEPAKEEEPAEDEKDEPAEEEKDDEKDEEPATTGGIETDPEWLVVATENEPPSVHPAAHNAVAGTYINMLTHDTLINLDENMEFQPNLATEWENIEPDLWEFKLRDDVYFHNGDHMTAEDVAESLLWVKQFPQVLQYNKGIIDTEVIDEYTVQVKTDGPLASFLFDIVHHANMIYPIDLMEEDYDFNADPVGTGPYIFKEWLSGEKLEFEANDEYFAEDRRAQIPNLSWRIIPEGSSRTIALENGEIDYIIEVATNDVEKISNTDGLDVLEMDSTSHNFLMINNEVAPFDNLDFRKALNAATDRDAVVQVSMDGFAIPTGAQTPIKMDGSSEVGEIMYDPELAQEYMEASGVDPADHVISIICSDDAKTRAGQVIQANWNEILGLNVEIERMDLATYLDATAEGDYQAAIGGFTSSSMLNYLKGVYHSTSIGGSNKTRTADDKLDGMIDEAGLMLDDWDGQIALMEETSEYINTELVPQIPLYQRTMVRAYNSNLDGVNMNMSGTTYYNLFSWK